MFSLLLLPFIFNSEPIYADDYTKEIAAGIVSVIATATINTGNIAYKYYYPTPEDNASAAEALVRSAEAQERKDYLEKKAKFKKCLLDNNQKNNNSADGIPTECEETARAFIICGGINEIIAMTANFNQIR